MLKHIFQQATEYEETVIKPYKQLMAVPVNIEKNIVIDIKDLKSKLDDMDSLSNEDLYQLIENNLYSILDKTIFDSESKYINYFTNLRFLDAFISVILNMRNLDLMTVVNCNTLCYDCLVLPREMKNHNIESRLVKLSSYVNRFYLPKLLGLGLSENLASMLLIARFSSVDIDVCVKRVNFIIINQPKKLMTEKMIEDIFKCLYDVMNEFRFIFTPFMCDVLPEYDEVNENTWWITDDITEVNSVMNLSILNILDNLPSIIIRNVLVDYTNNIEYYNTPYRFSLQTISDDYYRIKNIIYELQSIDNIYVP